MIVEEKSAKKFNCHYPEATHCSGAKCMAWRWIMVQILVTDDAEDAVAKEYYTSAPSETHGYCGIAGRP